MSPTLLYPIEGFNHRLRQVLERLYQRPFPWSPMTHDLLSHWYLRTLEIQLIVLLPNRVSYDQEFYETFWRAVPMRESEAFYRMVKPPGLLQTVEVQSVEITETTLILRWDL